MEGEEAAWDDLEHVYLPAADAGALPLRLYAFVPLPSWRRLAHRVRHLGRRHPRGRLLWGGLKEFADGSLGSRTALMWAPYADDPGCTGASAVDRAALREMAAGAAAAGLQVAVHAIGDRAVDEVLDAFEEVQQRLRRQEGAAGGSAGGAAGSAQPPLRIEHAQHISGPAAAARMAQLGVAATPNPLHLLADAPLLERRLGSERAGPGCSYALRELLDAGVTAAFASDWPVAPLEPLAALWAAEQRQPLPAECGNGSSGSTAGGCAGSAGGATWSGPPAALLRRGEALLAHTAAGAAAAGLEAEVGRIAPGLRADFVVLDAFPEGGAAAAAALPRVLRTYVDGECAWGCDAAVSS